MRDHFVASLSYDLWQGPLSYYFSRMDKSIFPSSIMPFYSTLIGVAFPLYFLPALSFSTPDFCGINLSSSSPCDPLGARARFEHQIMTSPYQKPQNLTAGNPCSGPDMLLLGQSSHPFSGHKAVVRFGKAKPHTIPALGAIQSVRLQTSPPSSVGPRTGAVSVWFTTV